MRRATQSIPQTPHLKPEPPMHADNEMFIDRRQSSGGGPSSPQGERRQFANSHQELSPEAARLGRAIDQYKLLNRRRFITYEEMLGVIKSLGYVQQDQGIL